MANIFTDTKNTIFINIYKINKKEFVFINLNTSYMPLTKSLLASTGISNTHLDI